jgi:calcium permeable stress-gated cation channel
MAKLCGFTFRVQASFFIAYVVTSLTSITSELTQTAALFSHLCGKCARCCKRDDSNSKAPSMPYHSEIPRILLFGLLGLTYFIVAPLILPFVLVYFCLGYFIFRNQVRISHSFFFSSYVVVPLTYHYEPASSSKGQ